MEGILQLINNLYDLLAKTSISQIISLPEIVVVGDQSSGKSSLLQSVILRDILPKGTGIVTKCPIRVAVKSIPSGEEYAVLPGYEDKKFFGDDISAILKKINDAQSQKEGISSKDILINFYTSKIPAITLVDLPGIIQNVDDGISNRLRDKIDQLVTERIQKENTIILAVCNSAVDLNNSIALRKAREADPKLERTILVFTKMDICQDPASVINPRIRTGLGHFGVMCRSQEVIERKITLEQQIAIESKFFSDPDKPYSRYPQMFGINSLRTKLEEIFKNHIMDKLPGIREKITEHKNRTLKELENLGFIYDDITDYFLFAQGMVDSFYKRIDNILDGKSVVNIKNTKKGGLSFRKLMENIYENLELKAEDPLISECQSIYQYSMGLEGVPTISTQIVKEILKNVILKKQPKLLETVNTCRDELRLLLTLTYSENMRDMKVFKNYFFNILDDAIDECFEKTIDQLKNMLALEYETVECRVEMIDTKNMSNSLSSLIFNLFQDIQRNIMRNFPKYVKYYLIQCSLNLSRKNIIESLNRDYGSDSFRLFPEIEKIKSKREVLKRDLESLTQSSRDIIRFFENI